jgi:hypothetical protein
MSNMILKTLHGIHNYLYISAIYDTAKPFHILYPIHLSFLLSLVLELNASGVALLSISLLFVTSLVKLLGVLVTVKTDLVPGKLEELIHALEASSTGLRNGEPNPDTTDEGNSGKAPEGSLGGDTALRNRQKHVGDSARVSVLVGEVKSHSPRCSEGTNAQREQFGGQEVLHRVPAESPTETRDVDHGDGAARSTLVALGENKVLDDTELGNLREESSDVDHGNGLKSNTDEKSALSADNIDEEESADNSGDELDDTEDSGDEKTFLLSNNAHDLEQIGSIKGDGTSAGPLREELDHRGHVETVQVARNKDQLLDLAKEANTLGSLELMVKSSLDLGDLVDDVLSVSGLLSETAQHTGGFVGASFLDEIAGRLRLEEAEDEDDAGHHDVKTGGDEPLVVRVVGEVEMAAVICEVSENDTDVDSTLIC